MKANNYLDNNEGVSPIVATLVLIVVAIIGAAAVALIMGSFSSNVSNQASAGDTASAASTTIYLAGAPGMEPAISDIAESYNSNHTGVKAVDLTANVGTSGSSVGLISVEQNIADIGLVGEGSNAAYYAAQLSTYPDLKSYQVGEDGVIFIAGAPAGSTPYTTITKADLAYLFSNGIPSGSTYTDHYGNVWAGVVMHPNTGAATDIGMAYLGLNPFNIQSNPNIIIEPNEGWVTGMVGSNKEYIGLINSQYLATYPNKVAILAIDDQANSIVYAPTTTTNRTAIDNINYEIKNNPSPAAWPTGLIKPLNFVTKGPASSTALSFIKYSQAPTDYNQNVFSHGDLVHVSQVNRAFLE